MGKRKRLTPAEGKALEPGTTAAPETKSIPRYPLGVAPTTTRRPPIAQVAGDAAAQAALDEVADELHTAKVEGRMVQAIDLDLIDVNHLVRDRMTHDADEMAALRASLVARGQQTPIEVVEVGQGRYGLISGWRRLCALKDLLEETGDPKFSRIQALIRTMDTVSDAYIAMVEENEIRADLTFYERARLAAEAVRLKLYPNTAQAVQGLFARASSAKRSKIGSFVVVHDDLGDALRFPTAIPERLGLALAGALQKDAGFGARLRDALRKVPSVDIADERSRLERALRKSTPAKPSDKAEVATGVFLQAGQGRVVLSGKGVDARLRRDLTIWLAQR
jgi:ParB family chromosome partitioning protein